MDLPKTEDGVTDWEALFEAPETGLISFIEACNSAAAVDQISRLIVEQLFMRADDRSARQAYRDTLEKLDLEHRNVDDARKRASATLREIKEYRKLRAGLERLANEIPDIEEQTAEEIFEDLIERHLRNIFATIQDDMPRTGDRPLPFILSPAFSDLYIGLTARHFFPELRDMNRGLIAACDSCDPGERHEYMRGQFNDRRVYPQLVACWDATFTKMTERQKLPSQPEVKKTGLLSKLVDKPSKTSKNEMSQEEWETEFARIEAENTRAEQVWERLLRESDEYLAPLADDRATLKGIFAMKPGALQKQISAITQIAMQQGSALSFVNFQQGKDIDLALLVVSYRYADTFLDGDRLLMNLMRSYRAEDIVQLFPYVHRFLLAEAS